MEAVFQIGAGATSVSINEKPTNMTRSNIRNEIKILKLLEQWEACFVGALVRLQEGACWKLIKALSNLAYQQANPPF